MPNKELIQSVLTQAPGFMNSTTEKVLKFILEKMADEVTLASSLSAEDVVLTDMMSQIRKGFKCFVLDTGRLNPETYDVLDRIQQKYQMDLEILFPDYERVEKMVVERGINLFYDSVENRKLCCQVRKVEPLQRVLAKYSGWITGLRREQSPTRTEIAKIERDDAHGGIVKVNPLADWSATQVWDYIKKNNVPYNKLYDRGYRSIGCAPCTRAIGPQDPERAGRWWWEDPASKECGLHVTNKSAV